MQSNVIIEQKKKLKNRTSALLSMNFHNSAALNLQKYHLEEQQKLNEKARQIIKQELEKNFSILYDDSKKEKNTPTNILSLPSQNQNRWPLFNDLTIRKRTIELPKNTIDLFKPLNNVENGDVSKTIIHILDESNGFGDFLRGSIRLAQYAKLLNVKFNMYMEKHPISNFLVNRQADLSLNDNVNLIHFSGNVSKDIDMMTLIGDFNISERENICISTNLYYNMYLVTDDIRKYINLCLTFKPEYYQKAKELAKFDKYQVLHIRCLDDYFNKEFVDDNLLIEIIKLQLTNNVILITNNYPLKIKLNKIFGFHFIDKPAVHTACVKNDSLIELESTVLEYIILSKSCSTHCISYYHHGSGFSEQCSVLNNIPYTLMYLPYIDIIQPNIVSLEEIKTNVKILTSYYNDKINDSYVISQNNSSIPKCDYSNLSFITLTNNGYVDYTLNCLESLKKINTKKQLKVYCVGEEGYNNFISKNIECEFIDDSKCSDFQTFRLKNWSNITYYKFQIIYQNLLNYEFVCITDGDIVYENNIFLDYLLTNICDNDLLIQSEGIDVTDVCSGFMFIKSNPDTIAFFNPENVEKYKDMVGWDDQVYINNMKHKLKFKKLPLSLFPTGQYYYTYSEKLTPYLIHFNWIVGHEKKNRMVKYNKWYVNKKVKICQYGTDGFGHQLEGLLRLISLSLNNKADYQFSFKKFFKFEHNNFNLEILTQYILTALKNLAGNNYDDTESISDNFNASIESRSFAEIMENDKDFENKVYCYDGIGNGVNLPSTFENCDEIKKSIPKLREAFVEKNNYLPTPSYDNSYINVVCHIRMGDAIGQRILDNEKMFEVIKRFQNNENYRVIVHSDGDVTNLSSNNTILNDANTDVLQVLSDFIFADILIINYSSLSIASHLLGNDLQKVICPTNAGPTFKYRVLDKCIKTDDFLEQTKFC
jgi:hypothetical protein